MLFEDSLLTGEMELRRMGEGELDSRGDLRGPGDKDLFRPIVEDIRRTGDIDCCRGVEEDRWYRLLTGDRDSRPTYGGFR